MKISTELQEIIKHAHEKAPAFRGRMAQAGLEPEQIRTMADFAKIPVLRKESLVDLQKQAPPFGGNLAQSVEELKRVFQSPGPIYDPQGRGEDYWRWAEALKAAGFGKGDVVLNTFSYHLSPAGFMFDDGLRAVGAVVVPTGVGNSELQVQIAADLQATGYVGTPSFLMTLLQKAEETGATLTIKKALLGGEAFLPHQKEAFVAQGIDAFQSYGTADVGAIAFECAQKEGMHIASGLLLEIVDVNSGLAVDDGETGEIVVTLFDQTYPLIRFGTGDLSKIMLEPCSCGLNAPRIAGWLGRTGDAVKVRGMFVHPRQITDALKSFPECTGFAARVSRVDDRDFLKIIIQTLETKIEPERRNAITQKLQNVIRVKPDAVEYDEKISSEELNLIRDSRQV